MSVQTVHISLLKQVLIGFLLLLVILFIIEGLARFYESQELPCHFIGKDAFEGIEISPYNSLPLNELVVPKIS
mgnify:CR=1 FL=1